MNSLRLALLLIGLAIVAGIYLWGVILGQRRQRSLLDRRYSEEKPLGALALELDDNATLVAASHKGEAPALDPSRERIVVLYLTAPSGCSYSGNAIQKAAEAVGMSFGKMNVFHHFGVGKRQLQDSLFCLANMHEPGSFDLSKMNTFRAWGLVLFMRLPGPMDGQVAFELMLNTALRLQQRLGGELRDDKRELLGPEQIERLRDMVKDG